MDDDVLAGIDRWLAAAAADERAAAQAAEATKVRRLADALAADDDLRSTLLALADHGLAVTVSLAGTDRQLRGRIVAAGDDFVVVGGDGAPTALIPLHAVSMVRLPPGTTWSGGVSERDTELGRRRRRRGSLRALLAGLAEETPEVKLITGAATIVGTLFLVGTDVATIGQVAGPSTTSIVPLAAISAVVLVEPL